MFKTHLQKARTILTHCAFKLQMCPSTFNGPNAVLFSITLVTLWYMYIWSCIVRWHHVLRTMQLLIWEDKFDHLSLLGLRSHLQTSVKEYDTSGYSRDGCWKSLRFSAVLCTDRRLTRTRWGPVWECILTQTQWCTPWCWRHSAGQEPGKLQPLAPFYPE